MITEQSLLDGGEPLEIERRYLIQVPDIAKLEELGLKKIEIRQDYLPNVNNKIRRIRKAEVDGDIKYVYTEKFRLSDTTRIERSREITEDEYNELFDERAVGSHTIKKTRYNYYEGDYCFQIDFYPEWPDKALVEVSLPEEGAAVKLPSWMKVIREVTGDRKYKNEYLAFNGFE